jgi:MFS family permease
MPTAVPKARPGPPSEHPSGPPSEPSPQPGAGAGAGAGLGAQSIKTKIGFGVCIATILLAVIDTNIVSAATVPIVRDLDPAHGINSIAWLISAYALAATAALPLYGKLCDTLGAKRVFLAAVVTFLIGSTLCGAAQSMAQLIGARALQGIGGGGLMSVTMVVLAQLKGPQDDRTDSGNDTSGKDGDDSKDSTPAKPGKGGSVGGLVAGAGMAIGPWLGGLLSDHANWRWIFYVNLPLGLAVVVAGALCLQLPANPRRHRIDYLGAGLAAVFSTALLLVTEWAGKDYAWTSPTILGLIAATVASLVLFLRRQATAAEPILPLSLFRVPEIRYGFLIQGLVGVAMMGSMVYVLIYLQVARGLSSSDAGLYLIFMALGMTVIGLLSDRLTAAGWSARAFVLSGSFLVTTACALLFATTGPDTNLWLIRAELLLMGLGFGQLIGQLIQLVQATAPPHQLGVATTGTRFFQTLGSSLGAALFGTLLTRLYESQGPGGSTSAIARLTGTEHTEAIRAFTDSIDLVFLGAAAVMLLALLAATRLPTAKQVA